MTDDRETANRWIYAQNGYAKWLYLEIGQTRNCGGSSVTVEAAAEWYIAAIEKEKGPSHNTTRNRASVIRAHIIPAFGSRPLASLTRSAVQKFLDAFKARKCVGGQLLELPAKRHTKQAARSALTAIWYHVFDEAPCPFAGVPLDDGDEKRTRREQIIQGEVFSLSEARSLTTKDLLEVFVAAAWYDRHLTALAAQSDWTVPLTLDALILLYATAMRVSELARLRWVHVRRDEGGIVVPGTKTEVALRVIPIQHSLTPWLERLDRHASGRGLTNAKDYVLPMHEHGANDEHNTTRMLTERINMVLLLSKTKLDGQSAHLFRRSWTMAARQRRDVIDLSAIQEYLGHSSSVTGATKAYIDSLNLQLLLESIPKRHRSLVELPTPEEIEQRLEGYQPPGMAGKLRLSELTAEWAEGRLEGMLGAGAKPCGEWGRRRAR